jgi:hypothetical protein
MVKNILNAAKIGLYSAVGAVCFILGLGAVLSLLLGL